MEVRAPTFGTTDGTGEATAPRQLDEHLLHQVAAGAALSVASADLSLVAAQSVALAPLAKAIPPIIAGGIPIPILTM